MSPLDSRTWMVWGVCCMVPLLIGRHPMMILQLLLIVGAVRLVCIPPASVRWGWIIRVAGLFAILGVIFNALTVRSGNQIAFHLPLLDWPITWNSIAYGIVSGLAMVCLVLIGTTTAAGLDWIALTRVLPARFAPLAVSGSVAWSFLPSASAAFADIREAQAARGHQIRSGRDVLPIVIPLLDGSLGRALTMSEALEARGFGASMQGDTRPRRGRASLFGISLIVGLLLLAYAISLDTRSLLIPALLLTLVGMVGFLRTPSGSAATTRYREHRLHVADIIVIVASVVALLAFLILASADAGAIAFNPYPNLQLPVIDYRLLLALAPLIAPAMYPVVGASQ